MLLCLLALPPLLGFALSLAACLRERGEDRRYRGDKVIYRS